MADSWGNQWVFRPASFDDIDLAVDMFNARSRAFYGENQSTADEMLGWWRSPRFELERDARVVLDGDGRMIGWVHVGNPGEPYVSIGCGAIVHPDVAGNEALWDRLYAWALEHARRLVPLAPAGTRVAASEGAMDIDEARRTAAERAGFERVRVENHMRIDLDVEIPSPMWPDGISVRTAAIDRDLPEMVVASREAFRDHWGFVDEPFEQALDGWRSWVSSLGDALDPTLWFVAHEGTEIAGLGLFSTRIADDASRSYVESLSVRPPYRKRGIALALLRHGFGELSRRGYAAVELDMDSENLTGALRLYERAGMRVVRRTLQYERVLRDGDDLATRALGG